MVRPADLPMGRRRTRQRRIGERLGCEEIAHNSGYTLVEFLPDVVNALTTLGVAPSKNLPAEG